jgi:hypothetical protein
MIHRRPAPSQSNQPASRDGSARKPRRRRRTKGQYYRLKRFGAFFLFAVGICVAVIVLQANYTVTVQSPVRLRFQSPFVLARRESAGEAAAAQDDQAGRRLTAYQQYACNKFGSACRIALAVQRAENARGACEVYHYNSDGTLDWGYFQINTVHLTRPGVNLRDLLDCKANIDFAYQLYTERGFQPWSTFNNGAYRQFLRRF